MDLESANVETNGPRVIMAIEGQDGERPSPVSMTPKQAETLAVSLSMQAGRARTTQDHLEAALKATK